MLEEVTRTKDYQVLRYKYTPKIRGISAPKNSIGKKGKWVYIPEKKKEDCAKNF